MYVPLKVTTDYSILKSLIKVKDLILFCKQKNITSCAICDNNLGSSIEFYNLCRQNDIKPIIGLEITILGYKIYLYARNYQGYKNLLKINTLIYDLKIDYEVLEKYKDDLLVIIPYQSKDIVSNISFYHDIYFGYETEEELKNLLITTKNVVYVNDIKCFQASDMPYLKYLDALREEKDNYQNNYFNFNLSEFDLNKMGEIDNLIDLKIEMGKRYIPKYNKEIDSYTYLSNLALKGLNKRLNNNINNTYLNRLKYELNIIKEMGFVDYFLIVYDYVLFAKKNGILVGPGRGSAAGSLVSYSIGITDIDPIKYNLLFERFLNPNRVTMPDIDIDFDNTKRDEVINYVKNRYGKENVSGGITFATLKSRLVLREVGKILNIDNILLDKFLKIIDRNKTLKENYQNPLVQEYLKNYQELNNLYKISSKLEGLKRNISTHAAGIVIGSIPLDEIIPMYKWEDVYLTHVPMEYLEDLGLLKMDFLALKNLSVISNIINKIPRFNIANIPLDDKVVYDLFCSADTDGIFQFETAAFKNMLVKYRPRNFLELVASIALVRPGPSEELETYIKRKEGKEKITYFHEDLKSILEETYGVIVYQEQVISILVKMANFSYAEADNIRRAMSKKKVELITNVEEKFRQNSLRNGYDKKTTLEVFQAILKFASYGFNKAHSVSYALVSYEMAYLKVHYPALFTFELLNSETNSSKIKNYLNELKRSNFKIMGVSINNSFSQFNLKNNIVYLPFNLIKNFPMNSINKILEERENGIFKDVYDFFQRTNGLLTRNDYLLLINASSLKELGYNNRTLEQNLDVLINYGNLSHDLGEYALVPEIDKLEEYDSSILREKEIATYGFFISNHPASKYNNQKIMKMKFIKENVFKNIICYVLVEHISKIKTKNGDDMAFIVGSDETGTNDFTIFPNKYFMLQNINKNDMIKVEGKVSKRYDKYSIIVSSLKKE